MLSFRKCSGPHLGGLYEKMSPTLLSHPSQKAGSGCGCSLRSCMLTRQFRTPGQNCNDLSVIHSIFSSSGGKNITKRTKWLFSMYMSFSYFLFKSPNNHILFYYFKKWLSLIVKVPSKTIALASKLTNYISNIDCTDNIAVSSVKVFQR